MSKLVAAIAALQMIFVPLLASADTLHLVCTKKDMTGLGGVTACAPNCPVVTIAIDLDRSLVTMPEPTGATDTYSIVASDSMIQWQSEHWNFQLDRYTGILRQLAAPKHNEQMLAVTYDWNCSPAQRQF